MDDVVGRCHGNAVSEWLWRRQTLVQWPFEEVQQILSRFEQESKKMIKEVNGGLTSIAPVSSLVCNWRNGVVNP